MLIQFMETWHLPSFADCDIFTQYSGIDVGHHAQYHPPMPPNQNRQNTDHPNNGLSPSVDECDDAEHSNCTSIQVEIPSEDEEHEGSDCDSDSGLEDAEADEDSKNTGENTDEKDYETDEDFSGNASNGNNPKEIIDTSWEIVPSDSDTKPNCACTYTTNYVWGV